jgi:hypothetical protein
MNKMIRRAIGQCEAAARCKGRTDQARGRFGRAPTHQDWLDAGLKWIGNAHHEGR